jgi:hypothetical protein
MSYAAKWITQLNKLYMNYAAEWTTFLTELNEDGFFGWVEWGRLFQLGWMRTAFSDELNETAFSPGLNEDGFFSYEFFICGFSSVSFYLWVFICEFSSVDFHLRIFICEFSSVDFHLWVFICEFSSVSFHLWVFICEFSSVNFHLWVFICEFLSVSFHSWVFSWGFSAVDFQLWIFVESYWLTKEWIANCCLSNLGEKSLLLYRTSLSTISSTDFSFHDSSRSFWGSRSSIVTRLFSFDQDVFELSCHFDLISSESHIHFRALWLLDDLENQ